jgi:DUF438 domain-containing protein
MTKIIDLDKNVHDLVKEFPELADIMADMGFSEVTKKSMLNSVGKFMTLPKGSKMKGIPLEAIKERLKEEGFQIKGEEVLEKQEDENTEEKIEENSSPSTRKDLLKSYLKRLDSKEDLESVRKDFVDNFSHVQASEIMEAEQDLIKEGMPLTKVQKLCDLHSALFHGSTREEKIAAADKAVIDSYIEENKKKMASPDHPASEMEKSDSLKIIMGHPLNTFFRENDYIGKILQDYKESPSDNLFEKIRKIPIHYAKKGDLLYPLLKLEYGISGPNDVMWKVDDEIRDEISRLNKEKNRDDKRKEDLAKALERAEEMVYKEKNILYPICADNFTKEEWIAIYHDLKQYEPVLEEDYGIRQEGEEAKKEEKTETKDDKIILPTGSFKLDELIAMLDTMPMEITFVDKNDINRYYNDPEGIKAFKRPKSSLGREVYSCHPAHIEPMVRSIIEDFKSGKRDRVPVRMEKNQKPYLVTYMAVRDKNKNYLGTLETVEEMTEAKDYFGK